uniref:Uncharacterized protein n=1 Tax=Mucochytrium quahogii TaxID=96639 RepID=A0A7S2WM74_9STRA|mmetsp:Transcript_16451/g.26757  ORF Transcript_16451/g.26757 Transcript_16451/m.26757 type:complete len:405 (+) Transcript_16451:82-1296(+)
MVSDYLPCENDLDCPGTLVCVFNVSWSDLPPHCDCSPFFGWVGYPVCDKLGTSAVFMLSFYCIVAFACSVAFVSSVVALVRALAWRRCMLSGMERNSANATYFLATLGIFSMVFWCMFGAANVGRPQDNTAVADDVAQGSQKYPELYVEERIFSVMAILFNTAAALNVSLMWVKVVVSTKSVSSTMVTYLNKYRQVVYFSELIHLLLLIPCFVLGVIELVIFVTMPFYVLIILCYGFGQQKLVHLLKQISSYDGQSTMGKKQWYKKQILRVRVTAIVIIAAVVFTIVAALIYGSLYLTPNGWQEYGRAGDTIGPLQVAYCMIIFGVSVVVVAVLFYSTTSMTAVIRRPAGLSSADHASALFATSRHYSDEDEKPSALELATHPSSDDDDHGTDVIRQSETMRTI